MRRRPAARGVPLRRPAAREERVRPGAEEAEDVSEKYAKGEEIRVEECPLSLLKSGEWFRSLGATYEGGEADVAGKVEKVEGDGVSWEVVFKLTGTRNEDLLKLCTAVDPPALRGHLCQADCDRRRTNPNLLHLRKLQKISPGDPVTWETNCEVVSELPHLQAAHEAWRGEKDKDEKVSSSSSQEKRKKKKSKKKEKKKQRKEKRKKVGGKINAQKTPQVLYSGTGLDPDPENRRILLKKIKARLKRSKDPTDSSSTSGSSGSGSEMEQNMLSERSKIQKIAEMAPGLLTCEGLRAMKEHVLTSAGNPWGVDKESLPPLVGQYVRQHCVPKTSAPMARELLTLAAICDCLLQARPAEAIDIAIQRVKALELMMSGQSWMTSQKLEIIPGPEPGVATRAELQVAQKESRLDAQIKTPGNPWEKGKGKYKGKDGDKGKGKGKYKSKESGQEEGKKSGK